MSLLRGAVGLDHPEDLQVVFIAALLNLCNQHVAISRRRAGDLAPFLRRVFLLSAWKKERVGGAGLKHVIFQP